MNKRVEIVLNGLKEETYYPHTNSVGVYHHLPYGPIIGFVRRNRQSDYGVDFLIDCNGDGWRWPTGYIRTGCTRPIHFVRTAEQFTKLLRLVSFPRTRP